MKKIIVLLIVSLCLTGLAVAADRVEGPKSCHQCGMDREVFARSRMQIVYADGSTVGECSLNCAAVEMKQSRGKQVKSLLVADYGTKKLIDARGATWVIGGRLSGVMTELPKWAFARKEDAKEFIEKNGGREGSFDEALNLALKENE